MARDLFKEYEKDAKAQGLDPKTIETYKRNIKKFFKYLGNKTADDVDKFVIRDYISYMREEKGFTAATLRYNLAAISSFYEWMVFEDRISNNPVTKGVRKRYLNHYKSTGEEQTHQVISKIDAAKMVKSCLNIMDKTILLVLFKTGIRRNELLSLDVDDVDLNDQSILLKPTKKRTNRRVYFDDECGRYLARWLEIRKDRASPDCKALFVSSLGQRASYALIHRMNHKIATRIGVHDPNSSKMEDHFSAHCCRHSFTTWLLEAGMPREYVKMLRGDAQKDAIDIYHHITPNQLKESYLAHIPPLGV
jgi:integrase/recombinase XerD